MAAALPAIIIAGTLASAGASIYGGIQANSAANREAKALQEQGRLAQEAADAEAQSHATDVRRFAANQSLAFLANGVSLAGSPLLVLEDTVKQGQAEVDSITRSGNAQNALYNQRATNTRNSGRAALIGGIGTAAGSVATMGISASQAGLFSSGGGTSTDALFAQMRAA
jgi:hypothetical protein